MALKAAVLSLILSLLAVPVYSSDLSRIVSAEHRSDKNKLRDQYRHPVATLRFFDIKPTDTVLEVWPGNGWYSEILAPFVKGSGQYIAASFATNKMNSDDRREAYWSQVSRKLKKKLADKSLYGNSKVVEFEPQNAIEGIADNSVDVAVLVRVLHVWDELGKVNLGLKNLHKKIKSGGTLAVVQHRATELSDNAALAKEGYLHQTYVIELMRSNGFELVATSEINANVKDTKDHPKGVYALPPTLAMGENNKAHYVEIGESDRMTLKFKKVD